MDVTLVRDEITWLVILGVFTVYQLANASKHTLLTIIVAGSFVYIAYWYLESRSKVANSKLKDKKTVFDADIQARNNATKPAKPERLGSSTKKRKAPLKYLYKNEALFEVAQELFFIRIFDKMKYADILMAMENMQKEYVNILASKYDARAHTDIFLDTAKNVLQQLYSLYFVIPERMKYIYGIAPSEVVERNITKFIAIKGTMIRVVESFCRKEKKMEYFPEQSPSAADQPFDFMQSRQLP